MLTASIMVAGLAGGAVAAPAEARTGYVVTVKTSARTATPGATIKVTGSVRPGAAGRSVSLQAYVRGAWKTIRTQKLSARSRFGFTPTVAGSGTLKLRVLKPRGRTHARGVSRVVTITLVKPAPQ
ncbi:hypothetical protein EFK50_04210 [Nocardioides marmoriginsengisoli]|uniref:Bacterial spore germination immunoglobulin-like domain-containing protein n=2 Tax=Nocardioides marmoriginsengisoli TaxID=661483 RepID=A0A3N0CQ80_9ACTN|nr:hypothetical protein EFK50_04210 [Nocardioides marmoriginsengisoli]